MANGVGTDTPFQDTRTHAWGTHVHTHARTRKEVDGELNLTEVKPEFITRIGREAEYTSITGLYNHPSKLTKSVASKEGGDSSG